MGAIAGLWRPRSPVSDAASLTPALTAMSHRGSSAQTLAAGTGALLASLTHDPVPGKTHLRSFESEQLCLVLDGRIENAAELRRAAGRASHPLESDAALLAGVWRRLGVQGLSSVRGAFAAAIFDKAQRELTLARDSFSNRPLFYCQLHDTVAFASEVRGLLALGIPRIVNVDRLPDFFRFGLTVGGPTLLRDVASVRGGTTVCFDAELDRTVESYYRFPRPPVEAHTLDEWASLVWEALVETVDRKAQPYKHTSVLMSAGVDSPLVACALAHRHRDSTVALTGGFTDPRIDEGPAAARIAERLQLPHLQVQVERAPGTLLDRFSRVIWQLEQPTHQFSVLAAQALLDELTARSRVEAVFSGDCADALYGGWGHVIARRVDRVRFLPRPLARLAALASDAARTVPGVGHRAATLSTVLRADIADPSFYIRSFCSERDTRLVTGRMPEGTRQYIAELRAAHGTGSLESVYSKIHLSLVAPIFADRLERLSSQYGADAVFPFTDDAMIELALRLPPSGRHRHDTAKPVLQRLFATRVGVDLMLSKKIGWPAPSARWMVADDSLRDGVQILLESRTRERGLVNSDRVAKLVTGCPDEDMTDVLWAALGLELWCRTFIDRDGREPLPVTAG